MSNNEEKNTDIISEIENNSNEKIEENIIVIPLLNIVMFPNMEAELKIEEKHAKKALKLSNKQKKPVFICYQKDFSFGVPEEENYEKTGVLCKVEKVIDVNTDGKKYLRVAVSGYSRGRLILTQINNGLISGDIECLADENADVAINDAPRATQAHIRFLKNVIIDYLNRFLQGNDILIKALIAENNVRSLFELIVRNIPLQSADSQSLLEEDDYLKKIIILTKIVSKELEIRTMEEKLSHDTVERMQKIDFYNFLKNKQEVIKNIIDDIEGHNSGNDDEEFSPEFMVEELPYSTRIEALNLPKKYTAKLLAEVKTLGIMPPNHPDAASIRQYLDEVLALPWGQYTDIKTDIDTARLELDKDNYGMERVKKHILETIAVHILKPDITGQILCLVGPPGTGKTSIGKSIAAATGRKYVRVSLGGVNDEADIRGHRKTYIGAMPGRIMDAIKIADSSNPLIMLDEIDKLGHTHRGDPAAALLEVLDPEQNSAFRDHFLEVPFDLSRVLFITTANDRSTIPYPLLDRMDFIELSSYTTEEKFNIAKKHLIPKQIKRNGLKKSLIRFKDEVIYTLIECYTKEAGVRSLERKIAQLCRKAAKEITSEAKTEDIANYIAKTPNAIKTLKHITFTNKNVEDYLGNKKYLPDEMTRENEIGVVNGLAFTSVGGTMLPIETAVYNGKGTLKLTGSLGDVMKESANIALSYARGAAEKFHYDENFYRRKDIHIHAPEGAVPKDGPSAGVTMVTSIISALSNIPVRSDVAMTGEISLRGKVMRIGGLREKTMAAYRNNIKTIIIPFENKGDLYEVDDVVKENVNFVFAKDIDDVLDVALLNQNNI